MLSNLKSHINKERESLLIYMRDDLSGLNVMQEKMDQAWAQEEGDQYFFNNIYIYIYIKHYFTNIVNYNI